MPFQAGRCEGCGFHDYLEEVKGAWLCKYCRDTLCEEGELELENGEIIRLKEDQI
jgi:predicted Zn-ribbon and HTH transcriptional regulator